MLTAWSYYSKFSLLYRRNSFFYQCCKYFFYIYLLTLLSKFLLTYSYSSLLFRHVTRSFVNVLDSIFSMSAKFTNLNEKFAIFVVSVQSSDHSLCSSRFTKNPFSSGKTFSLIGRVKGHVQAVHFSKSSRSLPAPASSHE